MTIASLIPFPSATLRVVAIILLILSAPPIGRGQNVSFNEDVRPILSSNCFACHGPDASKAEAGLRLDTFESATAALASGRRAIVPGDPAASEFMKRINHEDEFKRMPPKSSHKTLTDKQKKILTQWIADGANYEKHWAFVPPKRSDVPKVKNTAWPRNEIDHFVLDRLEAEGIQPSATADRQTLARRLYLDLVGLPPTPEQVKAFVNDQSPDSYERLVDQLLASPHYGERMAMPWLDAARYADTNGFSIDDHRDIWPWRDWVINAFNNNMPYDQFVIEQLAGDLLPNATVEQKVATGFLRNSMSTHEGGTLPQEYRVIYLADKVDTVSTVFLGLTMRCAQCHSHKYDPISQEEYYQFYAYFDRTIEHGQGKTNANTPPVLNVEPLIGDVEGMKRRLQQRIEHLKYWQQRLSDKKNHQAADIVAVFGDEFVSNGTALKTVNTEIRILEQTIEAGKVSTMIMAEQKNPGPTYLLIRGAYDNPDKKNPLYPGTPGILPPLADGAPTNRLGLAQWLVRNDHPLTARVAVNRYWQMLFGRGIVSPGNDFGLQGSLPTHPELLDWLARDYIDSGWDTKRLIKKIVMSSTYRQQSTVSPTMLQRDPNNELLARGARFRLPAEIVRDNALAVSGLLVKDIGGPSVYPVQPPGLWREVSHYGYPNPFTSQIFVPDEGKNLRRRSMYTFWKRTSPPPAMLALDAPTREVCNVERSNTNTPLQALVLLNDPQFMDAARALAAMAIERNGDAAAQGVSFMFERATARKPTKHELSVLTARYRNSLELFRNNPDRATAATAPHTFEFDKKPNAIEHASMMVVASVILNLDETMSKE